VRKKAIFILLILSILAFSSNSTFLTYTIGQNNKWKITQDAYLVSEVILEDAGLYYPEDMYLKDGKLYIADSGNARILVYDLKTRKISEIGAWSLFTPTGVFVDDNYIYVADVGLSEIVIFDKNGNEIKTIGKPKSILFGQYTKFKPRKIVVDKRGNLYIVSEGSLDGIIQLDRNGEFLGYFGANKVRITALDKFIDLFYSKEQKERLLTRVPKPYYNLAIDNKGLIYTITQKEHGDAIKKHNTLGNNILYLSRLESMVDEGNFVDITVDNDGRIYALTETGLIYEYDQEGNLIFSFGGRAILYDKNGLFSVASAIEVDDEGRVYVLDREKGLVQIFNPTIYATKIHKALNLYIQGKYIESKSIWEDVLKYDGYSSIIHNGLGKAYFQEGNYKEAALHFKVAYSKREYSEAYWEIRNQFLQKNMKVIIILLFVIFVLFEVGGRILKKKGIRLNIKVRNKLLSDILYLKNLIRHPIDSFYYLRKGTHGSILSATIIYALFVLVVTFDYMGRSFIFNLNTSERSVGYVVFSAIVPIFLWIFSNYLVSSINEGRGTLKNIYIFTAYSTAPYIIFQPFIILLTYVLTYNESFLISFGSFFIISWTFIVLFIGVKETHDYELKGTIGSIIYSIVWILVIILVFSIVYMLWDQIVETVYGIIQEVLYRVR